MLIAGTDEVGYGAVAGPIVAVTVMLHVETEDDLKKWWPLKGVDDSKKLTNPRKEALRRRLPEFIIEQNGDVGIGVVDVPFMNRESVGAAWNEVLWESVRKATSDIRPELLMVDGTKFIDRYPGHQMSVKKGDETYFHIAAASVLAKLFRDDIMKYLAESFPQYGWERNSGYGTIEHKQALIKHGLTRHHRVSSCETFLSK